MATRKSQLSLDRQHKAANFVMLAKAYNPVQHRLPKSKLPNTKRKDFKDIKDWIIEEKIDGIRVRWHNNTFMTRSQKVLPVHPQIIEFAKQQFGNLELDGEFSCGRGRFQNTISTVRNSHSTLFQWLSVKYYIFDVVDFTRTCAERKALIQDLELPYINFCPLPILGYVNTIDDISTHLERVLALGGEGVILRNPDSLYVYSRTNNLLKVKNKKSNEATIIGYTEGQGKHSKIIGALICLTPEGKEFKIGTGLSDEDRANPPKIGTKITYEYMELTDAGLPRHPSYICVRDYE